MLLALLLLASPMVPSDPAGPVCSMPSRLQQCVAFPSTTNYTLQSQAFNTTPTWDVVNQGAALPVITANAATAPSCALTNNITGCGTATADQVVFPDILNSGDYSFVYQLGACPDVNPQTQILWLRGVSTSGVIDISAGATCFQCNVSLAWTKCYQVSTGAGTAFTWGLMSSANGCTGGTRTAFSVYAWNADCQNGSATPPVSIYTTTTTATRTAGCYR